jgi:hypothetical protein
MLFAFNNLGLLEEAFAASFVQHALHLDICTLSSYHSGLAQIVTSSEAFSDSS